MLLGKRKEKLIRDLAAMVFTAVDNATARIAARPRRDVLEREEVERIAVIVVEAIKADRIEWAGQGAIVDIKKSIDSKTPVDPLIDSVFDVTFGNHTTSRGRLVIEPAGPNYTQFHLIAYLGSGTENFHVFKRGTVIECETAWPGACEWMEKRFPKNKA